MAYDEDLADRLRELLSGERDLTEKKMFGGLALLLAGNIAVAASGQGGLMVRIEPADTENLIASTDAYPMEMRGRPMSGWLRVDSEHVRTKRQLEKWVQLSTTFTRTLPKKT